MNRKLARMKLDQSMINRLTTKQIHTPNDLFRKSEYELIGLLDATEDDITACLEVIAATITPAPKTAFVLLAEQKSAPLSLVDGVAPLRIAGGITEFVGGAGAGKSQFCLQLSVAATLPPPGTSTPGGGVLFIDTEGTFSANRLIEIARSRYPQLFNATAAIKQLTQSVTVFKDTTSEGLLRRLLTLEETIIEQNTKLIVVDSIAALVRIEFDAEHMPQRQERLGAIASQLKYLGEQFRIPIVVTNQLTTKLTKPASSASSSSATDSKSAASGGGGSFQLQAALGVGWAHAVNSRFVIEDFTTHKVLKLAKSPQYPSIAVPFVITNAGFQPLADSKTPVPVQHAAAAAAAASATATVDGDVTQLSITKQH